MKISLKTLVLGALSLFVAFGLVQPSAVLAAGPAMINLGTAGNFRILAETNITDADPSLTTISGNVGLSPAAGSSIAGISCTGVAGKIYDVDGTYTGGFNSNVFCFMPGPGANKTLVDNAVLDMGTAYTAASAPATPAGVGATNLNVGAGTLSGLDFVPGVYTWGTNVTITNDITITGTASDVWVFQISGTLGIEANKKIVLAGGALSSNVFWQVADQVTIKTGAHFEGNILGQTSIAMQAGATLAGRALAQAAVTLIGNTITASSPAPVVVPPPSSSSSGSSSSRSGSRGGGTLPNTVSAATTTVVTTTVNTTTPTPSFPNTGFAPEQKVPVVAVTIASVLAFLVLLYVVSKRKTV